jgi:hypothetical protein
VTVETFTPDEDVLAEHENGTQYVVAAAGIQIPVAEAQRLGLIATAKVSSDEPAPAKPKRTTKKTATEE